MQSFITDWLLIVVRLTLVCAENVFVYLNVKYIINHCQFFYNKSVIILIIWLTTRVRKVTIRNKLVLIRIELYNTQPNSLTTERYISDKVLLSYDLPNS